jgi:hypothetical protein
MTSVFEEAVIIDVAAQPLRKAYRRIVGSQFF